MRAFLIPAAIVWAALILGFFYYIKPSAYMECVNKLESMGVDHPARWAIVCGNAK